MQRLQFICRFSFVFNDRRTVQIESRRKSHLEVGLLFYSVRSVSDWLLGFHFKRHLVSNSLLLKSNYFSLREDFDTWYDSASNTILKSIVSPENPRKELYARMQYKWFAAFTTSKKLPQTREDYKGLSRSLIGRPSSNQY